MLATCSNISHCTGHIEPTCSARVWPPSKESKLVHEGFHHLGSKAKCSWAGKVLDGQRAGRTGAGREIPAPSTGLPSDHTVRSRQVCAPIQKRASHCQLGTRETSRSCQEKCPLQPSETLGRCTYVMLEPAPGESFSPGDFIFSELHWFGNWASGMSGTLLSF